MRGVDLSGVRVAVLATTGFEQVELTGPVKALRRHGALVEIVSQEMGEIQGVNGLLPGKRVEVDRTLEEAGAWQYDALLLPGGLMNPDLLRQDPRALAFVRAFDDAGKPIAAICHAPWLFASAGLVEGRSLTSWPGIRDDVRNAGGLWSDEAVVHDDNWVTSRGPHDLPQFERAMLQLFAQRVFTRATLPQGAGHERDTDWGAVVVATLAGTLGLYALRAFTAPRRENRNLPVVIPPEELRAGPSDYETEERLLAMEDEALIRLA